MSIAENSLGLSDTALFHEFADNRNIVNATTTLGHVAYTLLVTPPHDKLHRDTAAIASIEPPQPLQPSIEDTTRKIEADVLPKADLSRWPVVDGTRLVRLAGTLIQFTDYMPSLHGQLTMPYGRLAELRESVAERSKAEGPLDFADQLDLALDQSGGDITVAMWNLFFTSRLHARWLDSKVVPDMPNLTCDEKLDLMLEWQRSLAATKEFEPGKPQDPAGDGYYAWTHALAKTTYSLAMPRRSLLRRPVVSTFHFGTRIMHKIVHSLNAQAIDSDHNIAAEYGNAIGETTTKALLSEKT